MGRAKAKKPKRERRYTLSHLLAKYDRDALWALLTAAGSSPSLRHRWTSIGALAHAAANARPGGVTRLDHSDLSILLGFVDSTMPRLTMMEDFEGFDPRLDVQVRLDTRVRRLFPGNIERPIADVDRALLVAEATDTELVRRLGFGVRDVMQVGLWYVDAAVTQLAPTWPSAADEVINEIFAQELAAARVLSWRTDELSPSNLAALEWMSCDASKISYLEGHPQSPLGRYMRVIDAGKARWLPVALIPEILSCAVSELAQQVSDSSSHRRFAQVAAAELRRLLWVAGDDVFGVNDLSDGPAVTNGNVVQWVTPNGSGHAIAVQLLASLNPASIRLDREPAAIAASRQAKSGGDVRVPLPGSIATLTGPIELVPLIVVATASHTMSLGSAGAANMSLDDLRWVASTSRARSDLFNFSRDLSRPDLPNFVGWETFDFWEYWRSNQNGFFNGGKAPDLISLAPHWSRAEWERGARRTGLEKALLATGLPGIREFDAVDAEGDSPANLVRWGTTPELSRRNLQVRPRPTGWTILPSEVPIAVSSARQMWSNSDFDLLHDLAGAIPFGVQQVEVAWTEAHGSTAVAGHRWELEASIGRLDSPLQILSICVTTGDVQTAIVRVAVDVEGVIEVGDGRPATLREILATAIEHVLRLLGSDPERLTSLATEWREAPPTLALDLVETPNQRNGLPPPIQIDLAHLSAVDREVATTVKAAGIAPGMRRGDEAKALDRDVLAPTSLSILRSRLARHELSGVVLFGAEQLERAIDHRTTVLTDIRRAAANFATNWDPATAYAKEEEKHVILRRSIEMTIEAAMRFEVSGTEAIDDVAWSELLAAGRSFLEATLRSESVHHQVTPAALVVSEAYELFVKEDEDPTDESYKLDVLAYKWARGSHNLSPEDRPSGDAKLDSAVDAAMVGAFGATSLEIMATMLSLAHWDLGKGNSNFALATFDELVSFVDVGTILGRPPHGRERIESAIRLLTTRSSDLASDDWKPWLSRSRKKRILMQPILELPDKRLIVAPHLLIASLTAYENYLSQGVLPWTQPPPPPPLETALAQFRDARNAQLEVAVAERLEKEGWTVIRNIRETKPGRLGVPSLQTEIDAVAGRASSNVIWLLEVKDPADTIAVPEIRRSLDSFYRDRPGKPSYTTQLGRKLEDLEGHAAQVAEALSLPPAPAHSPYRVEALFVTRKPVPAGFVGGRFEFSTLGQLAGRLDAV